MARAASSDVGLLESLSPVVSAETRVLVLGSMPGTVSLREGRYYAHPRNRFWPVMEVICGIDRRLPWPERLERLGRSGVGLWDVLRRCAREGSLDADIEAGSEEANDLCALLERHPGVEALACNGRKAADALRRLVLPTLPPPTLARLRLHELPSTSPANASSGLAALVEAWSSIAVHLERAGPRPPGPGRVVSTGPVGRHA
jgi:hypoxanthine-DNA glycosylase